MNQKIHIDQYIKEKVEMLTFSYEDNYWLEAEKLIIDAEKKKKRRFLFWIFLITSLSVLAIFFAVLSNPHNNQHIQPEKTNYNLNKPTSTINKDTATNVNPDEKENPVVELKRESKSIFKRLKVSKKSKENEENEVNRSALGDSTLFNKEQLSSKQSDSLASVEILNSNQIDAPHEYNLWLTEEENKKKFKKNRAFIGVSVGPTFNAKLDPAYFASIHVQKMLNKRWSTRLSTQLVATKFPYLNYKYTKTDYSFGERITNNEVQSEIVYGLQVPLTLHYRFYKFHSAFVGLGYTRYLTQKNKLISEYQGEKSVENEYGVSKDIRKNNVCVSLGYETIVWRKYQVGLSGQLPLLNPILTKQKSTDNSLQTFPEMKVYVLYNFIKLK